MRDSIARAFAAGVVTGALVTAGSIFCLGQAHATTNDQSADYTYLADITALGLPGTATAELTFGHLTCQVVASGVSIDATIGRLTSGTSVGLVVATEIVDIAVRDLCPQYMPPSQPHPAPSTIA